MAEPAPRIDGAMSAASVEALLEAACALDAAAAADAWDEALELEKLCRTLLEALLAGPQDLLQAEAIESVAMVYRRVMTLAEGCRETVATELRQVQQGRRATRAYDDAERGA